MGETPRPEAGIVFCAGGNESGIRRRATPARYALRLVVAVAYVGALVLALQLSGLGGVTDEPAQAEPVAVAPAEEAPPPRPASVPERIPEWAWATSRWHEDRSAGARPVDAPPTLPAWYWEWRAWRAELEP